MLFDQPGGVIGAGDYVPGQGQQKPAVGRALHAAPITLEQLRSQLSLQPGDLAADGRLGEMHERGRPGEAAGLRNGDERSQLV